MELVGGGSVINGAYPYSSYHEGRLRGSVTAAGAKTMNDAVPWSGGKICGYVWGDNLPYCIGLGIKICCSKKYLIFLFLDTLIEGLVCVRHRALSDRGSEKVFLAMIFKLKEN